MAVDLNKNRQPFFNNKAIYFKIFWVFPLKKRSGFTLQTFFVKNAKRFSTSIPNTNKFILNNFNYPFLETKFEL